ncbi:hypothetical protein BJ508DRAFT_323059 [Ascobolus immersus RN42]|uniref:Uncharacterized protein n=1 Tax=Ascobolus immersus RN42 TaxID=1160509 RepID=A0A3N4IGW2_ASCIM|nr:hypothetical protein BJ508DRAFT_323059 [Ascobolus immersus RN42]
MSTQRVYECGSSPIELLPPELKLEILLLSDFPTVFKLGEAISSFLSLYNGYHSLIQHTICSRDHSKEAIQLLGRFRQAETRNGMSSLSLAIFANLHTWIDENQDFGCFVHAEEMDEARRRFAGSEEGTLVVGNLEEALFLMEIEAYIDMLYSEARRFGYRLPRNKIITLPPKSRQTETETGLEAPGKEEDDPAELRRTIRKALLQFMIITTYFHDKAFAEMQVGCPLREHAKLKSQEALCRDAWLSVTSSKEDGLPYKTVPVPTVLYDYSYAKNLSVSEISIILSVATPVIHWLYDPPSNLLRLWPDIDEDIVDLQVVRLLHLCRCFPDRLWSAGNSERYRSLRSSYIEASSTGVWRPGCIDKVLEFEKKVHDEVSTTNDAVLYQQCFSPKPVVMSIWPRGRFAGVASRPDLDCEYQIVDIITLTPGRAQWIE